MTDILTRDKRSWNMSRIRSRNTGPEKTVRSFLHRMGYRFRLHLRVLPGTPDIVLAKYKTVIFVHGCFWHRHPGCKYAYTPKSRQDFWSAKFQDNIDRHLLVAQKLDDLGWNVGVIWECQTLDQAALELAVRAIMCSATAIPNEGPSGMSH